MELVPVESSNVAAIGYEGGVLHVRFRDGKEYEYAGVSESEHIALMTAWSKGRWLHAYRKGTTLASDSVASNEREKQEVTPKPSDDSSFAVVK